MKTESAPADGTASLGKCLDLFARIAADRGQTALRVLVEDMRLPRSTLYRLVSALEHAGFIVRTRRGHFATGLRVTEWLHPTAPNAQMAEASRPYLAELAAACGATAHLGILDNDMVTYLVKVGGGGGIEPFTQENAQLEAYCTGIGKVLLAWLPDVEQARYLGSGPFVRLTAQTITEPAELRAHLTAVRAQGWACDDGEIAEQLYCLAVPLWTETMPMRAAISLSFQEGAGRRSRADDGAHLDRLRACAQAIGTCGRRLGRA
jgi:IclR family acetate operon transcriptional repressor